MKIKFNKLNVVVPIISTIFVACGGGGGSNPAPVLPNNKPNTDAVKNLNPNLTLEKSSVIAETIPPRDVNDKTNQMPPKQSDNKNPQLDSSKPIKETQKPIYGKIDKATKNDLPNKNQEDIKPEKSKDSLQKNNDNSKSSQSSSSPKLDLNNQDSANKKIDSEQNYINQQSSSNTLKNKEVKPTPQLPERPIGNVSQTIEKGVLTEELQSNLIDKDNDENKIRHISVTDTFFYATDIFDKGNNVSRMHINRQADTRVLEDKTAHGTLVSAIIARINQNADIFAYSAFKRNKGEATNKHQGIVVYEEDFKSSHDKGVRVFNQSFGTSRNQVSDTLITNNTYILNIIKEYAKKDSIFVWAAGNESTKDHKYIASPEGLYPYIDDDARNGWIVAMSVPKHDRVNISDQERGTKNLSTFSNKIGEQGKTWGIAAKGEWYIKYESGNTPREYAVGTSYATPTVTAAVANVWEKFPWMDNHLVTMTILSSANKPGTFTQTEAPDDIFGWGILNENRALKGPGRLDKLLLTNKDKKDQNLFNINFDNRDYIDKQKLTWENNMAGNAGIYKDGTGTLYLTGANAYEGNTVVNGGKLVFTNKDALKNSEVTIKQNGTLRAENNSEFVGIENKKFKNDGSLEVYGKGLKIIGDYEASKDSRIVVDIHKSLLEVTGVMDMGGQRIVADIKNLNEIPKQQENEKEIIKANQINNYTNDYRISTKISPYINISKLEQLNNVIRVKYKRNSSELVLANLNQTTPARLMAAFNFDNVLSELSNNTQSDPKITTATVAALDLLNSDPAVIAKNYDELSANLHPQTMQLLVKQNQVLNYNLSNKIANLHANGFFIDSVYGTTKINNKGFAKTDAKQVGNIIGSSIKVDDLNLGFAIKQAVTNAEFSDNAGINKINSVGGYIFAKKDFNEAYVSSMFGLNKNINKVDRTLNNNKINVKYSSKIFDLYSEIGLNFKYNGFSFSPFVSANLTKLIVDELDEIKPLSIKTEGARFSNTNFGIGFRNVILMDSLHINTMFSHSILINPSKFSFDAKYNGANSKIKIYGSKQNMHFTALDLGLSYDVAKNLIVNIGLEQTLKNLKNDTRNINLGAIYKF